MTTRKAPQTTLKITETELIALVDSCEKQGFPVYVSTAIECTNRRTVAKLCDSGVIEAYPLYFGQALRIVRK